MSFVLMSLASASQNVDADRAFFLLCDIVVKVHHCDADVLPSDLYWPFEGETRRRSALGLACAKGKLMTNPRSIRTFPAN